MFDYNDYVGRQYNPGKDDCFSIVRRYFLDGYGLRIPNYARPDRFWEDPSLNLYSFYSREGFEPVFDQKVEIGDVLLMPLLTPFATHACIVVDDNLILHHPPGQLSTTDRLRPKWSSRATIIVRHPQVTEANRRDAETIHLHEAIDANLFRDPGFQEALERVVGPDAGKMRDHRV